MNVKRILGAVSALLLSTAGAAQNAEPRHELRLGSDTDTFNYTDAATAQSVTLTSKWTSRWTTSISSTAYQRFGADAQRFTGRLSRKLGSASWISIGAGAGHAEGVIPKREVTFEIGHTTRIPGRHFVRGVELAYAQQWLWFAGSKVLVISETSLFYLPRDWMFTLTAAGARASFHVSSVEWTPSGAAKLSFPLRRRLRGTLGFAVGTENFAKAEELGRFSARTFIGGIRYQLTQRQDIGTNFAFQDRTAGRTQTSVGLSYGVRF